MADTDITKSKNSTTRAEIDIATAIRQGGSKKQDIIVSLRNTLSMARGNLRATSSKLNTMSINELQAQSALLIDNVKKTNEILRQTRSINGDDTVITLLAQIIAVTNKEINFLGRRLKGTTEDYNNAGRDIKDLSSRVRSSRVDMSNLNSDSSKNPGVSINRVGNFVVNRQSRVQNSVAPSINPTSANQGGLQYKQSQTQIRNESEQREWEQNFWKEFQHTENVNFRDVLKAIKNIKPTKVTSGNGFNLPDFGKGKGKLGKVTKGLSAIGGVSALGTLLGYLGTNSANASELNTNTVSPSDSSTLSNSKADLGVTNSKVALDKSTTEDFLGKIFKFLMSRGIGGGAGGSGFGGSGGMGSSGSSMVSGSTGSYGTGGASGSVLGGLRQGGVGGFSPSTGPSGVRNIGRGSSTAVSSGGIAPKDYKQLSDKTDYTDGNKESLMKGTYDAFRRAGFSHEGAKQLASEVGRENSFNSGQKGQGPGDIFGTHIDPKNKAVNAGMFSWQGTRGTALMKELGEKGLLDKDGKMIRSQATLDAMAQFSRKEMEADSTKNGNLAGYLSGDKIDAATAAQRLGKDYIKWRIDDPQYRESGLNNRQNSYNSVSKLADQSPASMQPPGSAVAPGGKGTLLPEDYDKIKGASNKAVPDEYWGNPSDPSFKSNNLTSITLNSGRTVQVNKASAEAFKGFMNELEGSGYKINSLGGYADRANVNNPSRISQHGFGNAIDINPGKNPNQPGQTGPGITDLPPNVSEMAAKHGLSWGGDWKSLKDTMHFEYVGPLADQLKAKAEEQKAKGITPTITPQVVDSVAKMPDSTPEQKAAKEKMGSFWASQGTGTPRTLGGLVKASQSMDNPSNSTNANKPANNEMSETYGPKSLDEMNRLTGRDNDKVKPTAWRQDKDTGKWKSFYGDPNEGFSDNKLSPKTDGAGSQRQAYTPPDDSPAPSKAASNSSTPSSSSSSSSSSGKASDSSDSSSKTGKQSNASPDIPLVHSSLGLNVINSPAVA